MKTGYAPNTSSLYVNAIRGVMNQAWQQNLITQDHFAQDTRGQGGRRFAAGQGRNLRRT